MPHTCTGRLRWTTMWSEKIAGNRTAARAEGTEHAKTANAATLSFLKRLGKSKNITMKLPSRSLSLIHGVRMRHHGEGDLGWVFRRMMYLIMGNYTLGLVVIVTAGVQVSIEARKIAA